MKSILGRFLLLVPVAVAASACAASMASLISAGSAISLGDITAPYKEIIIKPYDLNSKNDTGTYYLPAELKFENTVLGNSSSIIGEYQISPSFKEKYQ